MGVTPSSSTPGSFIGAASPAAARMGSNDGSGGYKGAQSRRNRPANKSNVVSCGLSSH
jgi:hypothetical protein